MSYFKYNRREFCSIVWNLIKRNKEERNCDAYLCIPLFHPAVAEKFEQIQGIEHQWSDCYIPDEKRNYYPPKLRYGLTGVFKITTTCNSPETLEDVLFSFYTDDSYFVVTDDLAFAEKVKQPLVEKFLSSPPIEDFYERLLESPNSLFLSYRSLFRGWFVEDGFADEVDCLDGFVWGGSRQGVDSIFKVLR